MQPQPRAYLASLRRELRSLTASLDPATAGGLNYCVDQIIARLIVRDEAAEPLVAALETSIRATASSLGIPLSAPSPLGAIERRATLLRDLAQTLDALPEGSTDRKALEIATSRADEQYRKSFFEATQRVTTELTEMPAMTGWPLSAQRLEQALPNLLPHWRGATVTQLKPLTGIHAKEIYFLDLKLASGESEALVVRSDREPDITRVSVVNEFPLLRTLYQRGFAIPEPLAMIADADVLGQAALIMRRVPGTERALEALTHPQDLVADAARFLGRLHCTPIEGTGLAETTGTDAIAALWRRRIAEQFDWIQEVAPEPAPIVWRARRWLTDNVHLAADAATVVHGDFSLRNFLLNDEDRITSVLDWELAHIGHPAEDLGYLRLTVDAIMPWERFDALYREAGGGHVTREQIAYFDVWGLYRNLVFSAGAGKFFREGTMTDYFMGTAAITYYPQLLSLLTEAVERVD